MARPLALLLMSAWAVGCIGGGDSAARRPPPVGGVAPPQSPCGRGPPRLELGVGNPFEPRPAHRLEVQVGRQGGFHIEISLRARGSLDPDSVDVELRLMDAAGGLLARHDNPATVLPMGVDDAGPYCDYRRARMVLQDAEGGLLRRAAVPGAVAGPLPLEIRWTQTATGQVVHTRMAVELALPPDW